MNLEQTQTERHRRTWRRLAAVGLVVAAALVGIGRLALAQPSPSSEVAAPLPAQSSSTRLQTIELGTENFEVAPINWDLTGDPDGPRRSRVTTGTLWQKYHSAGSAIWFGDPATGDFGGVGCDGCPIYSGSATFLFAVPIPATDDFAYMTFWSWERTEMSIPTLDCYQKTTCAFDSRRVLISGTNDTNWVVKWDTRVNPTIENQWHSISIDISEYLGQDIRFRFEFDTVDGRNNDAAGFEPAGWYVDDIRLYTFTPSSFIKLPVILKNKSP